MCKEGQEALVVPAFFFCFVFIKIGLGFTFVILWLFCKINYLYIIIINKYSSFFFLQFNCSLLQYYYIS